jgi:hypothetical protein
MDDLLVTVDRNRKAGCRLQVAMSYDVAELAAVNRLFTKGSGLAREQTL